MNHDCHESRSWFVVLCHRWGLFGVSSNARRERSARQRQVLRLPARFLLRYPCHGLKRLTSTNSVAGVGCYNLFLKEVPLRRMFLWTACIGTALGSTQLILITGMLLLIFMAVFDSRKGAKGAGLLQENVDGVKPLRGHTVSLVIMKSNSS